VLLIYRHVRIQEGKTTHNDVDFLLLTTIWASRP
jgi:hypothetical protein